MKKLIAVDLDGTLAQLDLNTLLIVLNRSQLRKQRVLDKPSLTVEPFSVYSVPFCSNLRNFPLARPRRRCDVYGCEATNENDYPDQPGIEEAYGIRKLRDTLDIAISDMIFVGDAIFPGGNDYPGNQAGALSICVRDSEETECVIEAIIACLSGVPVAQPSCEVIL